MRCIRVGENETSLRIGKSFEEALMWHTRRDGAA